MRVKSIVRLGAELALLAIAAAALVNAWGDVQSAQRAAQRSEMQSAAAQQDAVELHGQLAKRELETQQLNRDALAHRDANARLEKQVASLQSELQSTRQGAVQLQDNLRREHEQVVKGNGERARYRSLIEGMLGPSAWRRLKVGSPTMSDMVRAGLKHMAIAHSTDDAEMMANIRLLLAKSLIAADQSQAAEVLIVESIEGLSDEFGDEDSRTVAARVQLARCIAAQEKLDQAVTICMEALHACANNPQGNRSNIQKARNLMLECVVFTAPPEQVNGGEGWQWRPMSK